MTGFDHGDRRIPIDGQGPHVGAISLLFVYPVSMDNLTAAKGVEDNYMSSKQKKKPSS